MAKTVLSFGEVLWDLLPDATILGGAPFNFAYRINSLGDRGYMISRLGDDELGDQAFSQVVKLGLETTFLQRDNHFPTGTVHVMFDESHNPDYEIIPNVAYDHIFFAPEIAKAMASADCLCFGTLAQRSATSRETCEKMLQHASNCLLFLDINLRKACFSPETIQSSLQAAHILKLNETEAGQLAEILDTGTTTIPDFAAKMIAQWELDYCLVTLAEKGVYAHSQTGEQLYIPGYRVVLVDSLGAGDAFSAGFIHKILRNASMKEACEFGNVLGAIVATQAGATAAITAQHLAAFQQQSHDRIVAPQFEKYAD